VGPCGGGYGNPLERDPEKVLSDFLDGFITKEKALDDYGVAITKLDKVDYEQTNKLRNR
jgi:N-methylhydantoinase B